MKWLVLLALAGCWEKRADVAPVKPVDVAHIAVPEVIVDEAVEPRALAVDDTHVYFAGNGSIWRAEKHPGAKAEKLCSWIDPSAIALDVAFVWWGDRDGVHRVPKQGGACEKVTKDSIRVAALAKRGNELVVAEEHPDRLTTAVSRLTTDGNPVDGHTVDGIVPRLVLAADGIYVATNAVITRIERDGGAMHEVLRGAGAVEGLVVVGDRVVFAHDGDLMSVVLPAPQRIGTANGLTWSMATDASYIYWGTQWGDDAGSGIYRVSIAGGKTETFERLGPHAVPAALVVDGDYLYWSNTTAGQILRKKR
jgi:hypothetical protein